MRATGIRIVARAILIAVFSLIALGVTAQETRKAIANPAPTYPEIARKMGLQGVVKLEVVIGADGRIKQTKVIGGHPVLVNAVEQTLKGWKYAPANGETTAQLQFNFRP